MNLFSIRKIEPPDNVALAKIIRDALTEFKANKPGTVYFDDSTDHLYELFQQEKGIYHVATIKDQILGKVFKIKGEQNLTMFVRIDEITNDNYEYNNLNEEIFKTKKIIFFAYSCNNKTVKNKT